MAARNASWLAWDPLKYVTEQNIFDEHVGPYNFWAHINGLGTGITGPRMEGQSSEIEWAFWGWKAPPQVEWGPLEVAEVFCIWNDRPLEYCSERRMIGLVQYYPTKQYPPYFCFLPPPPLKLLMCMCYGEWCEPLIFQFKTMSLFLAWFLKIRVLYVVWPL